MVRRKADDRAARQRKLEKFKEDAGRVRAPDGTPPESRDQRLMLMFAVSGRRYAIPMDRVTEIAAARPLTRVPNAASSVLGIMSLRGAVVTVVDVAGPSPDAKHIIIVPDSGSLTGFPVDEVLRPIAVNRDWNGDALTTLLDLDKLLS